MKKETTTIQSFCDVCSKPASYSYCCERCSKDFCFECWQKHGIQYNESVNMSSSADGHYCKECDAILLAQGTDIRHASLVAIKSLRQELEAWHEDFNKRESLAHQMVKQYHVK